MSRALLLAMLIASGGCTHAPVKPPAKMSFTHGWVLLNCHVVVAAELITNDGHSVFFLQRDTDPDLWESVIQKENELGKYARDFDINYDCTFT